MYRDYRDGRQFQGSKKKARKAAFAKREQKRREKIKEYDKLQVQNKNVDNIT